MQRQLEQETHCGKARAKAIAGPAPTARKTGAAAVTCTIRSGAAARKQILQGMSGQKPPEDGGAEPATGIFGDLGCARRTATPVRNNLRGSTLPRARKSEFRSRSRPNSQGAARGNGAAVAENDYDWQSILEAS